ncbi:O-linked N-acetylglucosamine transferase, SPINDLY family protein [Undibacterium terreum]|uniref:protein O-GlcNAc transferase n=1 Tax=Undibacterium terreum TaxID=1224302 RepID=A0A916XBP9_9BURK|nr:tetratricopeptide repeat protein [Undibacterium terreum]GGC60063.1 hypothetical protein GCM10011396_03710 [Undibacterium terreum]
MLSWLKNFFSSSEEKQTPVITPVDDRASAQAADDIRIEKSLVFKKLGDGCWSTGSWADAAGYYRQALALNGSSAAIHINLGFVLIEQGLLQEAKSHLEQAIVLSPGLSDSYFFLGKIAQGMGDPDAAITEFSRAVSVDPNFVEAYETLGILYRDRGEIKESVAAFRAALAINPQLHNCHTGLLFSLQYLPQAHPAELFSEHLQFAGQFEAPVKALQRMHSNNPDPERRLKIAYVSSDFHAHSVAIFMLPVLERHDRAQFEIFCYYNASVRDIITEKIQQAASHFLFCENLSDAELDQRIRADGIDILIDLNGHTGNHRLLTFARKPAPVQVSYLGYVDTTGLSAMDYRLTNEDANPSESDRFYSETLHKFKDRLWWSFRPVEDLREMTELPALKNGFITFVSANNISKISDVNIKVWSELMRSIPDARLLIMGTTSPGAQRVLERKFKTEGIELHRLDFKGKLNLAAFREQVMQADIALDTFPFNGGTTSCETFWQGLPLVTLTGESFASRVGYALLNNLGLPELAAANAEDFARIAIELSRDMQRLSALRQGMRARLAASSLSDELGFTKALEASYRGMWRKYLEKAKPE